MPVTFPMRSDQQIGGCARIEAMMEVGTLVKKNVCFVRGIRNQVRNLGI